jgi:RNA polymerase sigma-70 factor (ECF subfamily)
VQPHEGALRGYLRAQFPSVETDDVVQESYLKLLRAQPATRIASVKAFLFTIARNTAANFFRRQKIFSPVPIGELPEWRVVDDEQDVVAAINLRLQDALVADVIAGLPSRRREMFLLRVADGFSHAEIAARLGVSECTVRTQVARALAKCAERLRAQGVTLET